MLISSSSVRVSTKWIEVRRCFLWSIQDNNVDDDVDDHDDDVDDDDTYLA